MIPTSTDVTVQTSKATPAGAEGVAVLITEKVRSIAPSALVTPDERAAADRLLAAGGARGRSREVASTFVELPGGKHRSVLLVGLGAAEKVSLESVREAAGALAKFAWERRLRSIAVLTPAAASLDLSGLEEAAAIDAVVTGFLLASFKYDEYRGSISRGKEPGESRGRRVLTLVAPAEQTRAASTAAERARIVAEAQNFARTIASRPGNDINPPVLAKVASDMAKEVGLSVRVLDEKQMARLGMKGILAVGSGSSHPPRLIVLEYDGGAKGRRGAAKSSPPVLVVGKAITFDAGGISIKPAEKMGRMIYDKSGGVAVLGVMYALARLKLPVRVVGILSSAENILGSRSYRPGDILRMHNGVTVEVTNTDAEGRLVLGDALAWGIETYKPAAAVDMATLTGGVVIALGKTMAGIISNNDQLVGQIQAAAGRTGEKIWRLPLGDEQREQIKSDRADIVNSAGRDASPLQGAAFISYFVPWSEGLPWAHLDIAGVADTEKELPYYAKGATGWGIRTLIEWITARTSET